MDICSFKRKNIFLKKLNNIWYELKKYILIIGNPFGNEPVNYISSQHIMHLYSPASKRK